MRVALLLAVRVAVAIAFVSVSCAGESSHLFLGNPSQANASDKNNFLIAKPEFALSYNNEAGLPNWVSWRLIKSDTGEAERKRRFNDDTDRPPDFKRISGRDYVGSGFDRGHMCPHGDRDATRITGDSTFVMTNIVPQSARLNRYAWNQEEIYLRSLAGDGARIYIIAGPAGRGGIGTQGPASAIGEGGVLVPAACWKIAVVVPDKGVDDIGQITPDTRVIAVLMPNDTSPDYEWGQYRTSVAEIEKKTGLHFFDALPANVAAALKEKVDSEKLPPPVEPEWLRRHKAKKDAHAG